jgi:hypothetical protein
MKKILLLSVFMLSGFFSYAQLTKDDITGYLAKCDITSGELRIWNVYGWDPAKQEIYSTSAEYDLANCSFSYSETALTITIKATSKKAGATKIIPYFSINHLDYDTGHLQITLN